MANRIDRLVRYLDLLRIRRQMTVSQLAMETGVHRRTVFRDLAAMRLLGIQLYCDPKTLSYELHEPSSAAASVRNEEVSVICDALTAAMGAALCDSTNVRPAFEKLSAYLPADAQKLVSKWLTCASSSGELAIGHPRSPVIVAVSHAVVHRMALVIRLRRPDGKLGEEVRLAPFEMVLRNSGWWVIAMGEPDARTVEFAVIEIVEARVSQSPLDWPRIGGLFTREGVTRDAFSDPRASKPPDVG